MSMVTEDVDRRLREAELLAGAKGDPHMTALIAMLIGMREDVNRIEHKVDKIEGELKSAFPDGDISGHAAYHADLKKSASVRVSLVEDVIKKLVGGAALSLAAFIGYALLEYVKLQLGGGK